MCVPLSHTGGTSPLPTVWTLPTFANNFQAGNSSNLVLEWAGSLCHVLPKPALLRHSSSCVCGSLFCMGLPFQIVNYAFPCPISRTNMTLASVLRAFSHAWRGADWSIFWIVGGCISSITIPFCILAFTWFYFLEH